MNMTNGTKAPLRAPTFTTATDGEEIVRVPLATGETATLDRADWARLTAAGVSPNWTYNPSSRGGLAYVRVADCDVSGNLRIVSRLIMEAKPGEVIRYRDEDRLNLRRSNLLRYGRARRGRRWVDEGSACALYA